MIKAYQSLENFDLGLEALPVLNLFPGDCFARSFLASVPVDADGDVAVGTFADSLDRMNGNFLLPFSRAYRPDLLEACS